MIMRNIITEDKQIKVEMKFENNFFIGLFFLLFGLILILKGKYFDVSFTIYGPKIILNFIFIIIGILFLINWNHGRRK